MADQLSLLMEDCRQAVAPKGPLKERDLVPFAMGILTQPPAPHESGMTKGSKPVRTPRAKRTKQQRSKASTSPSPIPTPPQFSSSPARSIYTRVSSPDGSVRSGSRGGGKANYPIAHAGVNRCSPSPASVPMPNELLRRRSLQ